MADPEDDELDDVIEEGDANDADLSYYDRLADDNNRAEEED